MKNTLMKYFLAKIIHFSNMLLLKRYKKKFSFKIALDMRRKNFPSLFYDVISLAP